MEKVNDINNKYLVFQVDEEYAIGLSYVVEIIENKDMTKVPETPDYIAGIINLRGHVVPVIDVRRRFGKQSKEGLAHQCVIITKIDANLLGLVVDNVIDLVEIPPDKITPSPQIAGDYIHAYVKAIGLFEDRMQLIIDADRLVNYNDLFFLNEQEEPQGKLEP